MKLLGISNEIFARLPTCEILHMEVANLYLHGRARGECRSVCHEDRSCREQE